MSNRFPANTVHATGRTIRAAYRDENDSRSVFAYIRTEDGVYELPLVRIGKDADGDTALFIDLTSSALSSSSRSWPTTKVITVEVPVNWVPADNDAREVTS